MRQIQLSGAVQSGAEVQAVADKARGRSRQHGSAAAAPAAAGLCADPSPPPSLNSHPAHIGLGHAQPARGRALTR